MPYNPKSKRNLPQYKDLTDEQFEELLAKEAANLQPSRELEARIKLKLDDIAKDYDISDMKINDLQFLRQWAIDVVALEDLSALSYELRMNFSSSNATTLQKVEQQVSTLTTDIEKIQNALNITRRNRKADKGEDLLTRLEYLNKKANEFYEERMSYIICPNCKMVLGTIWTLYPKSDKNKITLVCERKLENGEVCNTKVQVTTKELLDNRGVNVPGVLPRSMI